MVFPARVADPDLCGRREAFEEVCAKFQSAGAANCLCSNGALVLDYSAVGTKYKVLHHFVISSQTIDRKITTWSCLLHQLRFSFAYAFQQRQFAVVVIVDADAEV